MGLRHLHLGDNLSLVLACEKGRSSSFGVLLCIRKLLALSIAGNVALAHRWHPSELNAADGGSRLWEGAGAPLRHAEDSVVLEGARLEKGC